jgi:phosphinothricin acetyltransferase
MRPAVEADLPAIVAIYNSTVAGRQVTADTEPVTVDARRAWFERHTSGRPILVHEEGGEVAAWLSFEPFHERPAYHATAQLSLYVAAAWRRRGLGRMLIAEAVALAPSLGIRTLVGLVFSHNTPSLRLLASAGFEEWGRLPDVAEMDGRRYSLTIMGLHVGA